MRYLIFFAALVLLMSVGVSWPKSKNFSESDFFFFAAPAATERDEAPDDPFKNLELQAQAAVLLDLSKGELIFKKNENLEWPLASLTKLVTAAVFYERKEDFFKDDWPQIPLTAEAVSQEGDDGFLVGESFAAEDLVRVMLVKSSNDAAYALADWLKKYADSNDPSWFVNEMNLFVSRLGFQKTYFLNPAGLDADSHLAGAYSSASEVADLFSWLIKNRPQIILATAKPQITVYSSQGRKHIFESTAKAAMGIPGLSGVKTGYTDLARGNIVMSFGIGMERQFIAVVLGSSYEGRFSDALKLYEAALKYVEKL